MVARGAEHRPGASTTSLTPTQTFERDSKTKVLDIAFLDLNLRLLILRSGQNNSQIHTTHWKWCKLEILGAGGPKVDKDRHFGPTLVDDTSGGVQ